MDLALHLGFTADGLKRAMTEREFGAWQVYARDRMLPWRRVELYLAQIAMYIATAMGGAKNGGLEQFMFDRKPEIDQAAQDDDEMTAEDVAAFFGAELRRRAKG